MTNLKGVKAGDELLWTSRDQQRKRTTEIPKPVTVEKVGRTLAYVKQANGDLTAYRIESGVGRDDRDGKLWTREDWAFELDRPDLEGALKHHGVEVWRKQLPVPVLKKLLAVMEEAEE